MNWCCIEHGITRFRNPDLAYAKRGESGVMIGYMQSMTPPAILVAVNDECRNQALPDVALTGAWTPGTTRLEHAFDRSFEVSPIRPYHFESISECRLASDRSAERIATRAPSRN